MSPRRQRGEGSVMFHPWITKRLSDPRVEQEPYRLEIAGRLLP